jgi:Co/Zn/Cd efflux system component
MKNFRIEFKWGIIFTVASILWTLIEKLVGLHDQYVGRQMMFSAVFGVVAVPLFAFALSDKKKNFYNGNMNWTQGFLSGVILSVIIAVLSPVAQYVSYEIISPDYFGNIIHHYVANTQMTPERAEAYFNPKSYMIQAVSTGISMGVLTSAIVALFIRTKTKTE